MLNHRAEDLPRTSLAFSISIPSRGFCALILAAVFSSYPWPFPFLEAAISNPAWRYTTLMNWCVKSVIITLYKLGYHLLINSSLQSKVPMLPHLLPLLVSQWNPGQGSVEPWNICSWSLAETLSGLILCQETLESNSYYILSLPPNRLPCFTFLLPLTWLWIVLGVEDNLHEISW